MTRKTDDIIIIIDRMLRNISDPPTMGSIMRQLNEVPGISVTRDMLRRYIERIERGLPNGITIVRQPIVSTDLQRRKEGRVTLRYSQVPPIPHLTTDENALLTNMHLLYQSVSNLPWLPQVRQLMEQMNLVDSESNATPRCLFLDSGAVSIRDKRSMRHLGDLFDAALRRYSVAITYHPFDGDTRVHEVSVLAVKQDERFWYAAVLNEKSLLRAQADGQWPFFWLAIDRIEKVTLSNQPYLTTEVNWDEYFGQVVGITNPYNKPIEKVRLLVYGAMREYLQAAPLHSTQQTLPRPDLPDEPLEVTLLVKDNHELRNLISSLMSSVVVLAPPQLANWQQEVLNTTRQRITTTLNKQ